MFLLLYRAGISIASLWNEKARLWTAGRRGQWSRLLQSVPPEKAGVPRYWMHCASLGEFEQGRPILEGIRSQSPRSVIILTFFSPSGYEVRKDYGGADVVAYLPMDGKAPARRFLNIIRPDCALFVKYEFWHYYLKTLAERGIPAILVSGAFRKKQSFFRPWGGFFRKMLRTFSVLSVQDKASMHLLERIGLQPVLTGDTRYDRVVQIAAEAKSFPMIEVFKGNAKLIVAGSTWPEDERILRSCLSELPENWKLVIAPHELGAAHREAIGQLFGADAVFYSLFKEPPSAKVLVIDNIGMLSSLYRYGDIAFVGGGFNKSGIHNLLEPAVFGLPVIMGPEYQKFSEAVQLVKHGFAFPVEDNEACSHVLQALIADDTGRESLAQYIKSFVKENIGATAKILAMLPPEK